MQTRLLIDGELVAAAGPALATLDRATGDNTTGVSAASEAQVDALDAYAAVCRMMIGRQ